MIESSIYLYGSSARGDNCEVSDTDILIVSTSTNPVNVDKKLIVELVNADINHEDISIYSFRRIKEMYELGHLYAWHLYLESRFIGGDIDRLKLLGEPAAYKDFETDVSPLIEILSAISEQLKNNKNNLVYEAGLAYVATRNIAMSASYFSEVGLSFSAYSPFLISNENNPFPLTHEEYGCLRSSRLAGSRGFTPPDFELSQLLDWVEKLNSWALLEIDKVIGGNYDKKVYG